MKAEAGFGGVYADIISCMHFVQVCRTEGDLSRYSLSLSVTFMSCNLT